ncbi:MAG: hypothetical protein WEC15_00285 [Flavobacteriales bacterium]
MRTQQLAIGLIMAHSSFCQLPVEMADQRVQIVRYDRVVAGSPGQWIFSGVQQGWDEMRTLLVARAADGSVLWESPMDVPAAFLGPSVMAALPEGFVLGGWPIECSLPLGLHHLQRRDQAGDLLWSILLNDIAPASISISAAGSIALGDDPEVDVPLVLVVDGNGVQQAGWATPWPSLRCVRWASDGTLLTMNEGVLARWTNEGELLDQAMIPAGALDLVALGADDLRVLHVNRLVRYDGALNAIDSIALTGLGGARWMELADDLIWITCGEAFAALDPVSDLVSSFGNDPIDGYEITGTAARDGLIMTAGNASVDGRSGGVMRSFTTSGEFAQHADDLAISIASVDSLYFEVFDQFPQIVRVHAQVTILVENHGAEVLDKLMINTQRTVGYCGADFGANVQPMDLQIPPGGTALVQMPLIVSQPFTVPVGDTLVFEQCFVALSPNDKVDRDPSDNRTCLEASFNNTTSISERDAFSGALIAPVPFTEQFTIELGSPPGRNAVLMIHDAAGRQLHVQQWQAGNSRITITAAHLPAGVLVVVVQDEEERLVRRVVRIP